MKNYTTDQYVSALYKAPLMTPIVGVLVSTRPGVKPEATGLVLEVFPAGTHEGIDETAGPLAIVGEHLFSVSDLTAIVAEFKE